VNGSVYFDVSKFPEYGKLSGRNTEEMMAGARVEVSQEKRNPVDFALWKKAEPNHIMQWPSPWGMGYPGWHLECSAMSTKYLGQPFDIHGGGMENKFPHHECEIAHSEAAHGVPFVRYWVHNNMVTVDGQKMGKSLGNFITLKQVFADSPEPKHEKLSKKYDPLAVRQLILNSHYRSPIDFSDAALSAAQSGYDKIVGAVIEVRKRWNSAPTGEADSAVTDELEPLRQRFEDAMNDDLNTAVALSVIFEIVRLAHGLLARSDITQGTLNAIDAAFRRLGGDVLGIVKETYASTQITAAEYQRLSKVVNNLIEERLRARKQKNFAAADAIRSALSAEIVVEDTPEGTKWRWK
jgi:cysteinyl-tRNA synthetase